MNYKKFLKQMMSLALVALIVAGCAGVIAELPVTSTPIPPTATSTPVPPTPTSMLPTATPTPTPPTSTPIPRGMNEEVCNEALCLTVTGAGDLGKSFVFDAPEGFHFLAVVVQIKNLTDEALLYADFAETTRIAAKDGKAGFIGFITNNSLVFDIGDRAIDAGETEEAGLLYAVSDESTEFSLIHDTLAPITLEVKEAE